MVSRRFWPTAGRLLFAFLMGIIYSAVVNGIVYVVTGPNLVAATVLRAILTIPRGLAFVAVAVVTSAELRFHESPTVLTPTLAAELRR